MTLRVALLTEVPAPFRFPLFGELAQRRGIRVRVLFLAPRDPRRPYSGDLSGAGFDCTVLPGRELQRGGRWIVLNRRVLVELLRLRPHAVILGGWNQPACWQALLWARLMRRPVLVWVESTARDARSGGGALERAKQLMLRQATAFLVPGTASRQYLVGLGVDPVRVHVAPNAVDRTLFRDTVDAHRQRRQALRQELGLGERTVVLAVCRLDPEKGVDVLLDAVRGLELDLVVAGAGADEAALRAVAPANARFAGVLAPAELARWYAAADIFALASRSEQWGMVLNEAAEAALPLVASDAAGAAADLVVDGESGIAVPAGQAEPLRSALALLAADPPLRARLGAGARARVTPLTATAWADAVVAAVEAATRR